MINKIVAVQGNHPSKLNPLTDTSVFLANEIQNKKYKIFYYDPKDLSVVNSKVTAKGWDCLCAGPAFNIGMLYGNLDEVHELISTWDNDKIINAYLEAPQKGFNTQLMGKDLLYWSSTLLDLSRKGLENRDVLSKKGNNETVFLNHLQKVIDNKTTNADHMISKFSKNENLDELYDK